MPAGRANTHPAAGSVPSTRPGCPLQTSINNSNNLHFGISLFSPHNFGNPLKRAGRGKKLPAVKNPHFLPKAPDKAGSPQGQDRGTPSPVLPIFNEALTNDSSMRAGAFPTLTHPGRAQLNTAFQDEARDTTQIAGGQGGAWGRGAISRFLAQALDLRTSLGQLCPQWHLLLAPMQIVLHLNLNICPYGALEQAAVKEKGNNHIFRLPKGIILGHSSKVCSRRS